MKFVMISKFAKNTTARILTRKNPIVNLYYNNLIFNVNIIFLKSIL